MRHPLNHIFDFAPETLRDWCTQRSMPAFRAAQILEWVYDRHTIDPAAMSNLAKRDRDLLASGGISFLSSQVLAHQSATDGTQKLLVQWTSDSPDLSPQSSTSGSLPVVGTGNSAPGTSQSECVMIPAEDETGRITRRTACISSQVGCPVGCRFCASGLGGLEGNLSAGRIVEQVWLLDRLVAATPSSVGPPGRGVEATPSRTAAPPPTPRAPRISNIVFMGMGEPLANLSNVIQAVRTIAAPWSFNISARRITISTVGLPRAIERLAAELDLPVTLALSLHAPSDELRRRLIPWAEYTTIDDLLASCQKWFDKTGREITLEYTLLRGINDRPEHAEQLARVSRTLRANVNLIRYNEVPGLGLDGQDFKRPRTEDVLAFQSILRERHVNTHIRRSRGRDIAAACGQLRHEARAGTALAEEDRGRQPA